MKKKVMIVGSGFRGFCDALHLMDNPDLDIQIVDSAPFFGGVMYSLDIEGFAVDKGVHIFDSIPVSLRKRLLKSWTVKCMKLTSFQPLRLTTK